jgi:hypothetical protein
MTANNTSGPLAGIKVLELGTLIAGPFCARMLAEFGAEVIKVESPDGGDPIRKWRVLKDGTSLWWSVQSRNKKSLTLNMKHAQGREIARKLALEADIIIENYRPGVLEKWELGYEQLKALDPSTIMVRLSGFGQTGPMKDLPGFGAIGESMGGLRYVSGHADRHATRQTADAQAARLQHLADVVRSGLALVGEIGGQHHFGDQAIGGARHQFFQMNIFRADAVQRRQPAHQHEVQALVGQRLFDHQLIGRRLDHAQQAAVALFVAAHVADIFFGDGIAQRAVMDGADRLVQRARQHVRAFAVMLQQVERHALRRLRTDAGQPAQCLRQEFQRLGHGSLLRKAS